MDIFAKCYAPSMADQAREQGIYPYFHALESRQDTEVIMEGKRRIMLGSNNYLGLTTHPEVIEAGIKPSNSMVQAVPVLDSSTVRCACTWNSKRNWRSSSARKPS